MYIYGLNNTHKYEIMFNCTFIYIYDIYCIFIRPICCLDIGTKLLPYVILL